MKVNKVECSLFDVAGNLQALNDVCIGLDCCTKESFSGLVCGYQHCARMLSADHGLPSPTLKAEPNLCEPSS